MLFTLVVFLDLNELFLSGRTNRHVAKPVDFSLQLCLCKLIIISLPSSTENG